MGVDATGAAAAHDCRSAVQRSGSAGVPAPPHSAAQAYPEHGSSATAAADTSAAAGTWAQAEVGRDAQAGAPLPAQHAEHGGSVSVRWSPSDCGVSCRSPDVPVPDVSFGGEGGPHLSQACCCFRFHPFPSSTCHHGIRCRAAQARTPERCGHNSIAGDA